MKLYFAPLEGITTYTYLGSDVFTLHKLKEIWIYVMWNFPEEKRAAKAIKKATTVSEFISAISSLPEIK